MNKPFKFRHTNDLVGGFVLLVLLLLLVGIFLAGKAQDWFEPVYEIRTRLPAAGTFGLRKGAEVNILQTPVGRVERIEVDDEGKIEAVMIIKGDFTRFIRSDSIALVKKKFAVAGDSYVEITRGSGDPLPEDNPLVDCRVDLDIVEQIQIFLDELRNGTLRALTSLDGLLQEHTEVAASLRSPEGNLQQFLAHLNELAAGLQAGEGTAGKLLKDPGIADEAEKLLDALNEALGSVQGVLGELEKTAAALPDLSETFSEKLNELPGVLIRAQVALLETEKLLKALQNHWLLRKYVEPPQPGRRIDPAELGPLGEPAP